MTNQNLLLFTDCYKLGHMRFYKEGITKIYSYLCARSTKKENEALFFGLQPILKMLERKITKKDAEEFFQMWRDVLGGEVPKDVKKKIKALVKLGYLPIEIKAVPEGIVIQNKNILASITNTHPEFAWVVGFFESMLLKVWYPTTVATLSHKYKKLLVKYANETSDNGFLVPFLVHDFGYRGVSSEQTAEIGGAAHLVSFTGSDNIPAIKFAKTAYKAEGFIAGSVPASEHSVMCSYGADGELEAFKRMLKLNPTGLVSIVSDTYDFFNVLNVVVKKLKKQILKRDGKVVIRPDSGNPLHIICGDPNAPKGSPENLGAVRILDKMFGHTINSKGYKELNPKIGLIYGDGMYFERVETILSTLKQMGYSTTTVVLGIGGLLLQQHNRDDLGFAIKATYAEFDGKPMELFKDPKTDSSKKSHKGLMKLVRNKDGTFTTLDSVSTKEEKEGELKQVFLNGKVTKEFTFNEVKENSLR